VTDQSPDDDAAQARYWQAQAQALRDEVHALKAELAVMGSLSRNVPGVIYVLEADVRGAPRLVYVNDGVREVLGLTPEAWKADFGLIYERAHPDDAAAVRWLCENAMRITEPSQFEYRAVVPGRGVRHVAGRAISGQVEGRPARFGYLHDVTEQKLYQQATLKAAAAEQASAAKSEFLSRMSHELRTPLNAVLGFAQLLKLNDIEPLTEGQRSRVDLMEKAGHHLLGVINDVLDLSRIEAGRLPLSPEPVAVHDAFEQALTLVDGVAREAGVRIHPGPTDAALAVHADRLRLRQVLVNLLSNAIKYNRLGGQVVLRAWAEGDVTHLEVADTGRGMTPEQLQHLFEPFNRLGAERLGVDGSGIGLVIVRRLLHLMGGDVRVQSTAGEGTRVTCTLPRAELPESMRSPARTSAVRPADVGPDAAEADGWFRVLYVEDNAVNIDLVRDILSMRPHCTLDVAANGRDAVRAVRERRPDLMLLDMQLGDMTGFDVVHVLDQDPLTAGVPRVALSADAMPDTMRRAQVEGFRWYLTKPLDVMALLAVVDALSDEARLAVTAR